MQVVGNRLKFAHFVFLSQVLLREEASGKTVLRILDVGCGPGNLPLFCNVPAAWRLFGVDLWPNQLRQAADKKAYEMLFQVNLVEGLPFASESFDLIVCSEVLMYVPKEAELIAELYRVLVPGGKRFVYNPINWFPGLHSLAKKLSRKVYQERETIALDNQRNWKGSKRACRITYYSFQILIREMRSANFHVIGIAGFRLFRNRFRLMIGLENYEWYRRSVLFITKCYPHLASDLFVVAKKEATTGTIPVFI